MHARCPCLGASMRRLAVAVAAVLIVSAGPAAANAKYAGMVYDVIAKRALYADDADEKRYPASLTKVMTLYIVFEELAAGKITLDSRFTVSKYAAARPPSKLGFKPGATIKVRDAILALVTKSANDVASTVAENISGSESAFARRMTKTARRLGMGSTTFRNASGLPNAKQVTTARDMIKLGIAIQRDFPQYYGVFTTQSFEYRGRGYRNHNRLLGSVAGVDGIKTGYIRASGFNLLSSVRDDGRHLVAVVFGGRTGASRNRHMRDLIARTLPKAKRGAPMVFAAWHGDGPPPVPRQKPDLRPLFASRLVAQADKVDPIARKVLAFARETRSAVGSATRPTASDAIEAVIAAPAKEPSQPEKGISAVVADAAVGASAAAVRPNQPPMPPAAAAAALKEPERTGRFAAAFSMTERPVGGRLDSAALVAAIARARASGLVPVAQQGAGQAAPAGWQIQLGAVPSPGQAQRLLADAVKTVPALRKHEKVTLPVRTERGTLYRARLAGFASRAAAEDACKRFANHDRPCWAVSM